MVMVMGLRIVSHPHHFSGKSMGWEAGVWRGRAISFFRSQEEEEGAIDEGRCPMWYVNLLSTFHCSMLMAFFYV